MANKNPPKSRPSKVYRKKPGPLSKTAPVVRLIKSLRYRSGVVVQRDIRRYQNSTELLILKRPFWRLAREILQKWGMQYMFTRHAIEGLQEASEAHIVELFQAAFKCTNFAKRQTVMVRDIRLARSVRE